MDAAHAHLCAEQKGEGVEVARARKVALRLKEVGRVGGWGDANDVALARIHCAERIEKAERHEKVTSLRAGARQTHANGAGDCRSKQNAACKLCADIGVDDKFLRMDAVRTEAEGEMSLLPERLDANACLLQNGQNLHRAPRHLFGGAHLVLPAEKGERRREKARRRSRRADVERCAAVGDIAAAAADVQPPFAPFPADAERRKTAEHGAGILREAAAGDGDVALAEGGEHDGAVQNALGGGHVERDTFFWDEFAHLVEFHTKIIAEMQKNVKKKRLRPVRLLKCAAEFGILYP